MRPNLRTDIPRRGEGHRHLQRFRCFRGQGAVAARQIVVPDQGLCRRVQSRPGADILAAIPAPIAQHRNLVGYQRAHDVASDSARSGLVDLGHLAVRSTGAVGMMGARKAFDGRLYLGLTGGACLDQQVDRLHIVRDGFIPVARHTLQASVPLEIDRNGRIIGRTSGQTPDIRTDHRQRGRDRFFRVLPQRPKRPLGILDGLGQGRLERTVDRARRAGSIYWPGERKLYWQGHDGGVADLPLGPERILRAQRPAKRGQPLLPDAPDGFGGLGAPRRRGRRAQPSVQLTRWAGRVERS